MVLQKYRPEWAKDFQAIRRVLRKTLSNKNLQIEHVGSTSIEGLAAKPIIDIDIVYTTQQDFENIKAQLEDVGYYHNGNQGIEDREVFKRVKMQQKHVILDRIRHHLYACSEKSEELKRHLLFRDYLRANEKSRVAYEVLKFEIAKAANGDTKRYAKMKEMRARTFVEKILLKAQNELSKGNPHEKLLGPSPLSDDE